MRERGERSKREKKTENIEYTEIQDCRKLST